MLSDIAFVNGKWTISLPLLSTLFLGGRVGENFFFLLLFFLLLLKSVLCLVCKSSQHCLWMVCKCVSGVSGVGTWTLIAISPYAFSVFVYCEFHFLHAI